MQYLVMYDQILKHVVTLVVEATSEEEALIKAMAGDCLHSDEDIGEFEEINKENFEVLVEELNEGKL